MATKHTCDACDATIMEVRNGKADTRAPFLAVRLIIGTTPVIDLTPICASCAKSFAENGLPAELRKQWAEAVDRNVETGKVLAEGPTQ